MPGILRMESDKRLRESVLQQLWSRGISVRAKDGVVALTGVVPNEELRAAAERLAKWVYGVKTVVNYLAVKPQVRAASSAGD